MHTKQIGKFWFNFNSDFSGDVRIGSDEPMTESIWLPAEVLRLFVLTEDPRSAGTTAAQMGAFLLRLEQWDDTRGDMGSGLPSEMRAELDEILGNR